MKNLIVLSLLHFSAVVSLAQGLPYAPFAEKDAVWVVFGTNGTNGDQGYDRYKTSGDTILNGNRYTKIYQQQRNYMGGLPYGAWKYFLALRQDTATRKVYTYTQQENLLYDFLLQPGDSVKYYTSHFTFYLDSISKLNIGNEYRRLFHFHTSPLAGANPFTILEGVGSSEGPFLSGLGTEMAYSFVCFKDKNHSIPLAGQDCILSSLNEIESYANKLKLLKEAEHYILQNLGNKQLEVCLLNTLGNVLAKYSLKAFSFCEADLRLMADGLYILQIAEVGQSFKLLKP